jgi:RimJ/RimL family protein N-acetyltransferase
MGRGARRVRLADGRLATIRPIRPSDRDAFLAFHAGLSDESRYLRYFSARRKLPEREIRHYTEVDPLDHAGVVTWLDAALVGHALYDRLADPEEAEVALEVADACQGLGIGTAMLEELAHLALRVGIHRFVGHVLPTNQRMLQVFRDLGFAERAAFEEGGVVRVELRLEATRRVGAAHRARAGARSAADPRSG